MTVAQDLNLSNITEVIITAENDLVHLDFDLSGQEFSITIESELEFMDDYKFTITEEVESHVGIMEDGSVILIFHNLQDHLVATVKLDEKDGEGTYEALGLYRVQNKLH